jgi:hypothetical protein
MEAPWTIAAFAPPGDMAGVFCVRERFSNVFADKNVDIGSKGYY